MFGWRCSLGAAAVLLTCQAAAAAVTLRIEAEQCTVAGRSQRHGVGSASGGTALWTFGGQLTWDAITPAGRYRLLLRVRAGADVDRELGVRDEPRYSATVDGRPVALRLVPGSLVYDSDDDNWAWLAGDAGDLSAGWHRVQFSSTWHYGRWDVFVLTQDEQFTPAARPPFGEATPPDLSLLSPTERQRYQGFTLWAAPLEANCPPDARPEEADTVSRVALLACRGERAAAAINVTNWLDTAVRFQAGVEFAAPKGTRVAGDVVSLRYAVPLPSPGEPIADALPELDEAGLVTVPAGETRQLWVEVDTRRLWAGRYEWRLRVRPLDAPRRCEAQTFTIALRVAPATLPRQHPLPFFTCEYDAEPLGMEADMPAHWVSLYHNCSLPSPADPRPDFSKMDRLVRRKLGLAGARGIYFEHWWFRLDDSWKNPAQRAAWVRGTRRWAQHVTRDLGLRYDQFVLHIYDEQRGAAVDDFLAAREIVREADPRVRVDVTLPAGITLAEVRKMKDAADVWCPFMSLLEDAEIMAFLRGTGKPIWPYHCAEDKRYWPPAHYRRWPWQLYHARADGIFLWTYLRADPWDGHLWDGGMVFPGPRGVVPSRRWNLLRQGLEDWLLLQAAERAGHGAVVRQAVAAVLQAAEPGPVMRHWHDRLVTLLDARGAKR